MATASFEAVPLDITANLHRDAAGERYINVRLAARSDDGAARQPITIIAVIDNSGSMGNPATLTDATAEIEFSVMDLAKHAVKTIAGVLNEHDQLAVVSYSTDSRLVLPATAMDEAGKAAVSAALETVEPDDNTNIWAGLTMAAELASAPALAGRHIACMLLTDGFPNVNPPRGILGSLQAGLLRVANPWTLHTFGFGYKLDSALLLQLANWGHGLFGFVPDCSMVGTVFINALAHLLATAVPDATLTLTTPGDGSDEAMTVHVGPVIHGLPRDVVVRIPASAATPALVLGPDNARVRVVEGEDASPFVAARAGFLAALQASLKDGDTLNPAAAEGFDAWAAAWRECRDPAVKALLRDVVSDDPSEGQVRLAPAHYAKWGKHYLRAYLRAQESQQCMNFKDPGLQLYGEGEVFKSLQRQAEELFCTMAPPKPSRARISSHYARTTMTHPSNVPADMSMFHNARGGCFRGDAQVLLADGVTRVPVAEIVPRVTRVWTPAGPATVRALVTCGSGGRAQALSRVGTLFLTPWHPIQTTPGGAWAFPADLVGYADRLAPAVYNLLLDGGHVIDIEGVRAVTLGHGLTGPVVGHPYFSSPAAVERDLARQPGWEEGRPVFNNLIVARDPATRLIVGWRDAAEAADVCIKAAAATVASRPAADEPAESITA